MNPSPYYVCLDGTHLDMALSGGTWVYVLEEFEVT